MVNHIESLGLHLIYDGASGDASDCVAIDIIAVHGLGANPDHAWVRHKNLKDGPEVDVRWLTDLLPHTLQNGRPSILARIFSFNYQSTWLGLKLTDNRLERIANQLLDAIHHQRRKDGDLSNRPLIFIGHSFGGLVIEQAITTANTTGGPYEYLINSLGGILLLGVPHRGSKTQSLGSVLANVAKVFGCGETVIMDDVSVQSMKIFDVVHAFMQIMIRKDLAKHEAVICFYENTPTDYLRRAVDLGRLVSDQTSRIVVEEASAVLPGLRSLYLDSDHLKLNKLYLNTKENNYEVVSSNLARIAGQAPSLIKSRLKTRETKNYYEVPKKLVRKFIGREDLLLEILNYFSVTGEAVPKILILHALGGQGKSQIALEHCRRSKESHRGIFWINASSEATTIQAFERLAAVLDKPLPVVLEKPEQKIKFVLDTLEYWSERWILVFDNYDRPRAFRNVKDFFPTSGRGDILLTSRNQELHRFGDCLEIPAMTTEDGLRLLFRDYTAQDIQENSDEGTRIIDRLGGLALAIDQAAAYIGYRRMTIADFLQKYEAERQKILDYTPEDGWEYSTMQIHGEVERDKALSAFTTWEMSFQQLVLDDPRKKSSAAHFLTLSSFLDPSNIGESMFQYYWEWEESPPEWLDIFITAEVEGSDTDGSSDLALSVDGQPRCISLDEDTYSKDCKPGSQVIQKKGVWDSNQFWDLIHKCHRLSLLQSVSSGFYLARASFSLHPLIRDWLQLRERVKNRRSYCQEAISLVLVCIKSFKTLITTPDQKSALMAHMNACLINDKQFSGSGHALGYNIESCHAASWFADMYRNQGRWKVAEELDVQVVETSSGVLGAEHPSTLTSMANLASTYWNQGRWKEAEELFVQVMETSSRVLGVEHPSTLTSMANLASTYRNQGRWKEAEELEVQVMETSSRVLGAEHPDTLTSMNNLAHTFHGQGRNKEATQLMEHVVKTLTATIGANHPNTLMSLSSLHAWTRRA